MEHRAAIASKSTTPKDSPNNDGAQRTCAPESRCATSDSDRTPSQWTYGEGGNILFNFKVSGPSPAIHRIAGEGVCSNALNSSSRPFLFSWRPRNITVGFSVGQGIARANRSTSMPLKRTSMSLPMTDWAAAAETAQRAASFCVAHFAAGMSARCHALRPDRWKVPTTGVDAEKQEAVVEHRGERLVEMYDVGRSLPQGVEDAPDGAEGERKRGDRSV